MYAQQSSIDPALAALMQTAQMVTPDNTPTVAAQVAQAAKQKMAPQGIAQGMPEAQEDFQAAMPSMMRNMQQQQMQQMVKQAMQPQPAGIEGLPAPNMQNMAEGGVVGFAGDEFGSYVSEDVALDELRVAEAKRRREDEERRRQLAFLEQSGAGGAAAETAAALRRQLAPSPSVQPAAQPAAKPAAQPAAQPQPRPQPRPQAAPQAAQPAAGIEQLVEPKLRGEGVPTAGQEILREAKESIKRRRENEEARAAAKAKMPDLNERGIAALQRAEAERKRLGEIDRSDDERRRWAGVFRGWGGDRDAYDRILTGIASRDSAANQAQLQFDQAKIKLQQAQQAEALGEFDRKDALEKEAAELLTKARTNVLNAQQIAANMATSQFSTEANLFNTKSSAQQRGLDREQQAKFETEKLKIEGAKLKQQAEQNNQMQLANRINAANITVNSAIEKMEKTLANKYGAMVNIINTMTPEMLQKQPQMAATYESYLKDKETLYKQTVEPAVVERNRLAAQVSGAQDLSKWGEPTVKKGG
jgi:hypothetical protein